MRGTSALSMCGGCPLAVLCSALLCAVSAPQRVASSDPLAAASAGPYSVGSFQIPKIGRFDGGGGGSSSVLEGSSMSRLHSWQCRGSCSLAEDGTYELLQGVPGEAGALWHPIALDSRPVVIELDLSCSGVASLSDGVGLFVASSATPEHLTHYPAPHLWNLMNFDPHFRGIGVAFATRDRADNEKQSVSLVSNDGSLALDVVQNVPSRLGVYFQWIVDHVGVRISIANESISLSIRTGGPTRDYQKAFTASFAELAVPHVGGYLIISGSNTRRTAGKNLNLLPGDTLLKIDVKNFRLSTYENQFAVNPHVSSLLKAGQLMSDKARDGDVAGSLQALNHLLMNHLIPRQEWTSLNLLSTEAKLQELHKLLYTQSEELKQLRDGNLVLGVKGLTGAGDRAIDMQKTVKSAQNVFYWTTLGLGALLIGFVFLVYKRIGDWEKKHYL